MEVIGFKAHSYDTYVPNNMISKKQNYNYLARQQP